MLCCLLAIQNITAKQQINTKDSKVALASMTTAKSLTLGKHKNTEPLNKFRTA